PPTQLGPTAAAVAVALSAATTREVDAEAAQFLREQRALSDKQGRMLDLQMEHLHEERALHHRHLKLKYFSDRLRIGLQLLAIGIAIVGGLGAVVWKAANDHGLVVEAFSVPPDLATQGNTGAVVASRILDRIAEMQSQTSSFRAAGTYRTNWGDDFKVEIPDT